MAPIRSSRRIGHTVRELINGPLDKSGFPRSQQHEHNSVTVMPRSVESRDEQHQNVVNSFRMHPWDPQNDHYRSGTYSTPIIVKGMLRSKFYQDESISGRWLRDMCSCSQCRNRETGQQRFNVLKLSAQACKVKRVTPSKNRGEDVFNVQFADGHLSTIPSATFTNRGSYPVVMQRKGAIPSSTWTADICSAPPSVPYTDLQNASGLASLLHKIREFGFAFVDDMPHTAEATETLLKDVGPIRNTHYGAFYDFTSDLSSKDTAYTSEALDPHTDNTYFTEPAGLQALHLLSHTDGSGGESSLVDGFGAARQLYDQDPEAYKNLSLTGVYSHASGNDGVSIQPLQPMPVFVHHSREDYLMQVRWNTADRAGIACGLRNIDRWYSAAAKFDAILSDPKNQYKFQLRPGKLLLFDNWRVLHGRSAFTGKRRMCGGYINRDDFISKFRMTNLSKEQIKASTLTG